MRTKLLEIKRGLSLKNLRFFLVLKPMTSHSLLCLEFYIGMQDNNGNSLEGYEKIGQVKAKGPQ